MNDALGDRMKVYERLGAPSFLPGLPVIVRLDGRNFSNWTRGLARPYDERLSRLMVSSTMHLVKEFDARAGYTQSDEISLLLYAEEGSDFVFAGKPHKLASVLASALTGYFVSWLPVCLPERVGRLPQFDARTFAVPSKEEAANAFLWRERDAAKNSVQMAAREHYSHTALHGKSATDQQEMLFQKGVNWNDFPSFFKRGTFIQRFREQRRFTTEEIDRLPLKHEARTNPELMVERRGLREVDMPPFSRVLNRVGVLFEGEAPVTEVALLTVGVDALA